PVVEEVAAGEAETTTAILALDGPGDGMIAHVALALHWHGQDRDESRILLAKANVVIELVLRLKRDDAGRDRVLSRCRFDGHGLDLRVPAVLRGSGFVVEVPPDPFEHLVAGLLLRHERGPVDEAEPAAALHLLVDDSEPVADEERMIALLAV